MSLRAIPSIDQLRQRPAVRALEARFGSAAAVEALRESAAAVRQVLAAAAEPPDAARIVERIEAEAAVRLDRAFRSSLRPVINATGVVIHTNLGRAPLAPAALERIAVAALGYTTLEYDLGAGTRGRRDVHAEGLLCRLTGAEAAVVVNNNAAATLLVLAAIAAGREVIVSRGELVEIGGGFRVPDVMRQSGAILREVGTTNKTRIADYAAALSEATALLLRVHPSNFRVVGFTERPELAELAALGRRFNLPVAEDLGSGQLAMGAGHPLARIEPTVNEAIAAGAELCCFSGDKLLGGPQAGIIVGRREAVDRIRRHPLVRALRVDKLTYAALEGTLIEYASGRAAETVPVQRMIAMTADEVKVRAAAVARALNAAPAWTAALISGASAIGGGSAPGVELPTWLLRVSRDGMTAAALDQRLRGRDLPVIARIEQDAVVLDLRTVLPEHDAEIANLPARDAS